jgi:hypothetical protein
MRRIALAAAVVLVILVAAPVANAKFRLWLTIGDRTPSVNQPVRIVLHSERRLGYDLKLIAVAPGKSWFNVVGVVTGDSRTARATIPRDGFRIPVARIAGNRWRAVVKFPRRGRWRLVIPNGAPVGFMIPPPVMEPVDVR